MADASKHTPALPRRMEPARRSPCPIRFLRSASPMFSRLPVIQPIFMQPPTAGAAGLPLLVDPEGVNRSTATPCGRRRPCA